MLIQKMFVIIAFNEMLVERAVATLAYIPAVGSKLQEPFKHFLLKQKLKLRRKPGEEVPLVCIIICDSVKLADLFFLCGVFQPVFIFVVKHHCNGLLGVRI
jgi:hypothetical protein